MTPKSNRKNISKEEYYQLKAYQQIHNELMGILESIEYSVLDITQDVDNNGKLLLGSYSGDMLNSSDKNAVDDLLKILGVVVEGDKIEKKNMKDVGKVNKKKFKSGSWKGKKGVEVDFDESPEMKKYLEDHKIVLNSNVSDNVLLFIDDKHNVVGSIIGLDKNGAAG